MCIYIYIYIYVCMYVYIYIYIYIYMRVPFLELLLMSAALGHPQIKRARLIRITIIVPRGGIRKGGSDNKTTSFESLESNLFSDPHVQIPL